MAILNISGTCTNNSLHIGSVCAISLLDTISDLFLIKYRQ